MRTKRCPTTHVPRLSQPSPECLVSRQLQTHWSVRSTTDLSLPILRTCRWTSEEGVEGGVIGGSLSTRSLRLLKVLLTIFSFTVERPCLSHTFFTIFPRRFYWYSIYYKWSLHETLRLVYTSFMFLKLLRTTETSFGCSVFTFLTPKLPTFCYPCSGPYTFVSLHGITRNYMRMTTLCLFHLPFFQSHIFWVPRTNNSVYTHSA